MFYACDSVPREFDFNLLSTPVIVVKEAGDVVRVMSFDRKRS